MKLSTRGRYGLKAMFDLAMHYGEGPISLTSISERQAISVNYLEQLISPLRKAGLVKSIRGAQGGYMLARPADKITVGIILTTLEGPLAPTDCVVEDDDGDACDHSTYCVTKVIYEKIYESITSVVNSITLQHMVDDYEQNRDSLIIETICECK
ncbi:RrF2 family transcriptional regulator [Fusibacter ferrireducens]|uniref:Rrf2 family transcriptional regulator n=1 Tax=Fusibacter ferrireducens TaxID=2785058 RepID=A0ABR9ZUR2_9FIRM|nr:Rrf2 family transcriptional regulator [Fusibacter ferrireducens]MBF4693706.1 Rrf2 family transcriptional regulator [Fusibacter ferrireducens]